MESSSNNTSKKSIEDKINDFGQILQNFGLNLIQKIGEMNHQLQVLSDKVGKIEDELIDLKALKNNLQETSKFRAEILEETQAIKAQINRVNVGIASQSAIIKPENSIMPQKIDNPVDVIYVLEDKVHQATSAHELIAAVQYAKEELFLLTGGHKILLELKNFEKKIKPGMDIFQEHVKEMLEKKIEDWKVQL